MDNITPLGRERPQSPWVLCTIGHASHGTGFDVCAWTGAPGGPDVARMYLGARTTLAEAAAFAHGKAAQLGIGEIVDFTDAPRDDDGGEAA